MRRPIVIALAVVATVVAAGCSIIGGSGGDLTGKTWELTAITEKVPAFQGVIPPADQGKYTITFNTDGTYNAKADCNQASGTYKTSGSSLTVTPGPSTMAFCGEGSFGDLYVNALGNATSYAIANNQLTITLKDGGTLSFVVGVAAGASASPAAAASSTAKPTAKPTTAPTAKPSAAPGASPTAGLTGKTWQLTAITEKAPAFQGVVPDAEQTNYSITFADDGTFQAKADCNAVSGTYTSSDAGDLAITIGPSTMVACADGSIGDLYVIGLSNAKSYAIANDVLTITLVDEGTLVFK